MPRPLLIRVDHAPTWDDLHRHLGPALLAESTGIEWALAPESVETLLATKPANPIAPHTVGCIAVTCPRITPAENKTLILDALDLASSLGASTLNVSIPPVGGPHSPRFDRYQDALNFAYTTLHTLRLEAETRGVALALEAPASGCLHSPVELRELIDAANSSAVGACLNLESAARFASPEDWLTTLGPRIRAIRLSTDPHRDRQALDRASRELPADRPPIARSLESLRQFSNAPPAR